MIAPPRPRICAPVTSGAMWAWQSKAGRSDGDKGYFLQATVAECERGVEIGVRRPQPGRENAKLVQARVCRVPRGGDVVAAKMVELFQRSAGQGRDQVGGVIGA